MTETLSKKEATRDGFGKALVKLGEANPRVVALCADLTESLRMEAFARSFPKRFVELGVAEQNLAGVAAGFALAGQIPFAASYACFHPANSWGVIRTSICYSNLNVKIVGGHAGLTTGQDGATHQSLEDIATMRVLPNMTVVVPADAQEAYAATLAAAEHVGPLYLRLSKYDTFQVTTPEPFQIGQAVELKAGSDITLVACGAAVSQAMLAATELETHGISTQVINMHTIKPLDTKTLFAAVQRTGKLITIEDHQAVGGLGSAVAEALSQSPHHPHFKILGVQDTFGESGTSAELLKKYQIDSTAIVAAAREMQMHLGLHQS